jgi:hypothetical protein
MDQFNLFGDLGIAKVEKVQNNKGAAKVSAKTNNTKPTAQKPIEEEYKGVRTIKVYGEELFTIEDPKVTSEQIRQKIVEEFHFPEFSKDRTQMSLDKETGIVVPVISFQKKG